MIELTNATSFSVLRLCFSPEPFGDGLLAEKQRAENVYKSIEADHLMEFFTESCGDDLVGYDRGYITFTIGQTPKWTKGLNEKMDEALEAFWR